VAAALGIGQLARLDERNARRRQNADALTAGLADLDWLRVPVEPPGCFHVFHQYTLRVPRVRDRLAEHLRALGIATRVYYPSPIHKSALYRQRGLGAARCPEAERAAAEVLSIPVHPALGEVDVRRIVEAVRGFNPRH
jgi:dTDP-4-amino-4,6-dideoxygalactose transaminase